MCSEFLVENTKLAAALKTDCSRCNSCPEIPDRTELTTSVCTSVKVVYDPHCVFDGVLQHALTIAVT